MTSTKRYLTVLLTSAALLGAGAASAQTAASPQGQPPAAGERGAMHEHHGDHGGKHFHKGMRGHHGGHGMMLRGLDLTEAQKDQIFKLKHAQAPAAREQMKIVRASRTELRKLSLATTFDAAKARQLASAEAQARATLTVMRAETSQKVFALLTPAQQQTVLKRQQERAERHGGHKPA